MTDAFRQADFDAVIERLRSRLQQLETTIFNIDAQVRQVISMFPAFILPPDWRAAILDFWVSVVDLVKRFIADIYLTIAASWVVRETNQRVRSWLDIQDRANEIAAVLRTDQLGVFRYWTDSNAQDYLAAVKPQGEAVLRLGSHAQVTASVLRRAVGFGNNYYGALLNGVVIFAGTIGAAWHTLRAASRTPLSFITWTSIIVGALTWAITSINGAKTAAEAQLEGALLVELETERRRIDAFPNFAWPDPFTERFRDARP